MELTILEKFALILTYVSLALYIITIIALLYKEIKPIEKKYVYFLLITLTLTGLNIAEACLYLQLPIVFYIPMISIVIWGIVIITRRRLEETPFHHTATYNQMFYWLTLTVFLTNGIKIYLIESFLNG